MTVRIELTREEVQIIIAGYLTAALGHYVAPESVVVEDGTARFEKDVK